MYDQEFVAILNYVLLYFSFVISSELIVFSSILFILSHLISCFLRIRSLLVPYAKVLTKSIECILLTSFEIYFIQDGIFWSCSRRGQVQKGSPLPNICHIYPTMMKLGVVISYFKKIQKINKSRNNLVTIYVKN